MRAGLCHSLAIETETFEVCALRQTESVAMGAADGKSPEMGNVPQKRSSICGVTTVAMLLSRSGPGA